MRIAFWKPATDEPAPVMYKAPSGECSHLWSNWSAPAVVQIKSWSAFGGEAVERDGWAQDRHCLHCNLYQRAAS